MIVVFVSFCLLICYFIVVFDCLDYAGCLFAGCGCLVVVGLDDYL